MLIFSIFKLTLYSPAVLQLNYRIMKARLIYILLFFFSMLLYWACAKDTMDNTSNPKNSIDTITVTHSMKGWELYSWPAGNEWYYSLMVGTNRIKTYAEVTSAEASALHLITVIGIDTLKLVFAKFPENEYITWIGKGWLESSWGGNYGNLQLPPQNTIEEITQFCNQKKLNLQLAN
jgi:hypothetical protein